MIRKILKIAVCLSLGLLMLPLAGCIKNNPSTADDITLRITVPHDSWKMEKALMAEFPEIHFEFEHYRGPNTTEYLRLQLQHDDTGDILFGTLKYDEEMCRNHLLDLSGYSFVGNYESSVLNQYDMEGAIYLTPGPIMIRTMAYNKTLFEEKGWQPPANHKELVALVKQIRAESDMTPIAFGAKGLGYFFTTMTTYAQTAYLADARWIQWEKRYLAGDASCKEGFQDGIDMLQQLIDAEAYDIELDIGHWDSGAMDRLINREAAMIAIWGGQSEFVNKTEECSDEFVLFPFYTEDGEPFLGTNISFHTGLARRLGEPGNEKKLENALKIMEWISTPEGLSQLNAGQAEILPIYAADNLGTAKIYRDVWETNLSGLKAPMLYVGYEDVMIPASELIRDAMKNGGSLNELTGLIDNLHQQALHTPQVAALGTIAQNFSKEQTVQLMADVLYESHLADMALVSAGGRIHDVVNIMGVSGKLYEGALFDNNITIYMPGGASNAPLVTMTLTGEQICSLLENGKCLNIAEKNAGDIQASAVFDYYWSGIKVEMEDGRVKSMRLADGTPIRPDGVYTVAFAQGDYTEQLAQAGKPVTQNTDCQTLFKAFLKAKSPLAPPQVPR